TSKNRKRNPVLRTRMRVQQYRHEHYRVPKQNRGQRLPPVHARADQPRRKHVGRDAMRHTDPERGVVIRGPVSAADWNRSEVFVPERTRREVFLQLYVLGLLGLAALGVSCFLCFGVLWFGKPARRGVGISGHTHLRREMLYGRSSNSK